MNSEEMNEESESTQNGTASQRKKRKMTRIQRELKDWSVTLLTDAKNREEARERRHKEAIAESKTAITVYKDMMQQLIDKL